MLKQRIITALILLALLLPSLVLQDPRWFVLLTLGLMAAGAWEWGRLQGLAVWPALACGAVVGMLLVAIWMWAPNVHAPSLWILGVLIWLPGGLWLLRSGLSRWSHIARTWRLLVGWLAIALAWLALVAAKGQGLNFLLSVLTLVWAADVAAYFGGRAWGRRKLAEHISPGKTWAGAWSGVAAVGCLGLLWLWADTQWDWGSASLYTVLWQRSPVLLPVGVALLVGLSIGGDLVESLIKRVAGVKDSSGLLPGHGGVLDRVDALLPVLPVAMWLSVV